MKKFIWCIILLLTISYNGYSDIYTRVAKYLYNNNIYDWSESNLFIFIRNNDISDIKRWNFPGILKPTEENLPSEEDSRDVENIRQNYLQTTKPSNLKTAENDFMNYCENIWGVPGKRSVLEFAEKAESMTNEVQALIMIQRAQGYIRDIEVQTANWGSRWYEPMASWYFITNHPELKSYKFKQKKF